MLNTRTPAINTHAHVPRLPAISTFSEDASGADGEAPGVGAVAGEVVGAGEFPLSS